MVDPDRTLVDPDRIIEKTSSGGDVIGWFKAVIKNNKHSFVIQSESIKFLLTQLNEPITLPPLDF